QLNSVNIDTLMQKLSESETQNTNLRRKILEREREVQELSSMLRREQINVQKGDYVSSSVKAVQAHLQRQIQRKEAENNELKVKIQTLEKKIAGWKHQVGEYKHQMIALKETSEPKKAGLKKAVRSQKQRAQCSEEAVKNLTSKTREHEVKLCEIWSASNAWKKQHDRMVEEKTMLEFQTEDLKNQITSLLQDLERKKERRRNSEEEILGKLNSLNSENEKIYLENEKLKACIATLEISNASVEYELLNLQEKVKLQENLIEQYKNEVTGMFETFSLLQQVYGFTLTFFSCDATVQVRDKTEAELQESEHVCDLLETAEEKPQRLISWERIHAEKCKAPRELQVQDNCVTSLGSDFLEEENCTIQKKYEDLKRQLEKVEFQNEELAHQLRKEDECLQCCKLQLEEKIAEYNALTRQLKSASKEGRKMLAEEQEKISYKEQDFQSKLLILETQVREGQEEKKNLLRIFHRDEKHHEVCLKELENSLQKSENKIKSIQNYVQFLKAAYMTMFG
ncbi:Outer dense fiber protein 2-like, partial [Acanthisitta chloris]